MTAIPGSRRLRMAIRLGSETRSGEIHLRADSIDPTKWRQKPDGDFSHSELESLCRAWALDQLELRIWTGDRDAGLHLFHRSGPAESTNPLLLAARARTVDTTKSTEQKLCECCRAELTEEHAPWQSPADAWRTGNEDER